MINFLKYEKDYDEYLKSNSKAKLIKKSTVIIMIYIDDHYKIDDLEYIEDGYVCYGIIHKETGKSDIHKMPSSSDNPFDFANAQHDQIEKFELENDINGIKKIKEKYDKD